MIRCIYVDQYNSQGPKLWDACFSKQNNEVEIEKNDRMRKNAVWHQQWKDHALIDKTNGMKSARQLQVI